MWLPPDDAAGVEGAGAGAEVERAPELSPPPIDGERETPDDMEGGGALPRWIVAAIDCVVVILPLGAIGALI